MGTKLNQGSRSRLERSCGSSPADWVRTAPSQPAFERIEAYFTGHAYDPHRHDTYAIGYTLSGVQCFDYRGALANSTAGHAIVLHPDEVHDGRSGSAAGFCYRMLYLEPRLVRDALGDRAGSLPFVRSAVMPDTRLLSVLVQAFDDLDRAVEPLQTSEIILSIAEALLARDPSAAGRRPASSACAVAVERARAYLEAHFDRTVASEELEAQTGLDRYALARHFRLLLGTSPYRYLTMRRLDGVRSTLRAGEGLAEAAVASGFADQSHMTRQFKQAYGVSPGRWRDLQVST